MNLVGVVLSGGAGTRLWPLSRSAYPKQFHTLIGQHSLLQQTCERARYVTGNEELVIVSNDEHRFLVIEQLRTGGFSPARVILEPTARNTAPALALAALKLVAEQPDVIMVVMPSDHAITEIKLFADTVATAASWAAQERLVAFGIKPKCVETGYGYIERGSRLDDGGQAYTIERFVEKPNLETATRFVADGNYFWNSGIFVFKAATYLEELKKWRPNIYQACAEAVRQIEKDDGFLRVDRQAFAVSPSDSIDYAVMENTDRAVVVPYAGCWSDIGSWSGLAELGDADQYGNVTGGDVVATKTNNTFVKAGDRLIALIGVSDMIVVDTDDVVLIARKGHDQDVKSVVAELKQGQRREVETHTKVYRPWGSFQQLDHGEGFQVKRLIIKPGASISLQLHHKRSEHWVVVRGEAWVTKGEDLFVLKPNESTYIPCETVHKLENKGNIDLEVIEVQTGTYLGEDDIERIEDKYGRA